MYHEIKYPAYKHGSATLVTTVVIPILGFAYTSDTRQLKLPIPIPIHIPVWRHLYRYTLYRCLHLLCYCAIDQSSVVYYCII